ncbi:ABC transporter ATP-binding protein [Phytoactinopolyspora endophytica]|uniref:ABC transporter ATP-binding protein n=1 Tax=Phytoactinopolyspora endophytica TaxID=1642495 RepID=UPI00101DE1FE|nr:ABC transporter ATP-binding protein [Phytoactinopolyspora endophytica]
MSCGASVRLSGLKLAFGDTDAAEIDLDVRAGEVIVLLGPSGCGKSTILRALAGLLEPVAGLAQVGESVVAGSAQPPSSSGVLARKRSPKNVGRTQCAMVFQDDALLPWRTARRNVEYALKLRGVPRGRRQPEAEQLLRQVGLDGFGDHLPGALSGGMRQRVQLARTLAAQPRVLLMDEPFGALDAQTRSEMQRLLCSVWQQHKTTILFVTHDVDEALLLADRVVLLTPRPARVRRIVEIESPRRPGAQFEPDFARRRYEILASLGDVPGAAHEEVSAS